MNKQNSYVLKREEIEEVKQLANQTRKDFGVFPDVPLGSDIRMLLEKEDILLCEYPFADSEGTHTYTINIYRANESFIANGEQSTFVASLDLIKA